MERLQYLNATGGVLVHLRDWLDYPDVRPHLADANAREIVAQLLDHADVFEARRRDESARLISELLELLGAGARKRADAWQRQLALAVTAAELEGAGHPDFARAAADAHGVHVKTVNRASAYWEQRSAWLVAAARTRGRKGEFSSLYARAARGLPARGRRRKAIATD